MTNFLSDEDVQVDQLLGSYCDITTKVNETEKVCGFENSTLADMESGCVHVRGDVFVESGDEEHVEKLETVKSIFGTLVINGTNLTDVDFLSELEYVASLKREFQESTCLPTLMPFQWTSQQFKSNSTRSFQTSRFQV